MIKINILNKVKDKVPVSAREWQCWTREIVKLDGDWLVEILIVSPQEIKKFNRELRRENRVTDVLSFPIFECPQKQQGKNLLGTIVICLEVAQEQARENNRQLDHELKFLFAHGLKHLLGKHHQ